MKIRLTTDVLAGLGCAAITVIFIWIAMLTAAPVPTIILTSLAILAWLADRNSRRREEARVLQEEERALPDVQRFVAVHHDANRTWPIAPSIPDEDIQALGTILQQKGIGVRTDRLVEMVRTTCRDRMTGHFARSFLALHSNHAYFARPEHWAQAYLDTFEQNLDYLPYLARVMTIRHVPVTHEQLHHIVAAQIEHRVKQRRVQALSQAMATGATVRARRPTIHDVDKMSGLEFERFLGTLFRAMGYQVQVTKASGDQGADLILEKFGERTVVQAKCYSDAVSNSAVQEAFAAMGHYRCQRTLVVTNNHFTRSAKQLAASNAVQLWDRDALTKLIATYL